MGKTPIALSDWQWAQSQAYELPDFGGNNGTLQALGAA